MAAPARRSLTFIVFIGAILVLAFGLRLAGLGRQSLWYDEGVSAYLTTLPLAQMTRWTAEDIQPPLYYYLLAGWTRLFGRTEAALRWPSVAFSLLTVALAWRAGRRLHSELAGVLAALFCAVSPLYVWYAQEARNYALLTCLGLLASLLFYELCEGDRRGRRAAWLPYAGACALALYTHYFAVFLFAAHALYYAVQMALEAGGAKARSYAPGARGGPVYAWLLAGLTYLPWLPYQFGRLRADESYWQGTLKLGEALQKTVISFALGETVLERIGCVPTWSLALGFFGIAALGATAMALRRRRAALFLAFYLLIPVAGVLALALRAPKFTPRYVMPASPAFFLLLACAIAGLARGKRWRQLLAGLLTLCVLAGFAYADRNLYADTRFSKADFRGVAAYLRAHQQPDEALLLLSGHIFPIFDYYLPDVPRILLPAERTLSTERVVSFADAGALRAQLAGKAGVWIVRWQDEVVDPNGVVETLLDAAGQRQDMPAAFWQVRLEHYRLPGGALLPAGPPIARPATVNFGGRLQFAGWSQARPDEYVLFWQALQSVTEELAISLRLLDVQGLVVGQTDRRPAGYLYPTSRWRPGEIIPGRGRLPASPGLPPGEYYLEIRAYAPGQLEGLDILDAAGAPQGKATVAGPFLVAEAGRTFNGETLGLPLALNYEWEGQLALRSMSRLPASIAVGETLLVELGWECLVPTAKPWSATVKLRPAGGEALGAVEQDLLVLSFYPTDQWRAGEWLHERVLIRAPAYWPAGPADVVLTVSPNGPAFPPIQLGQVMVRVPHRTFEPPAGGVLVGALAEEGVRLHSYALEPARPAAGAPVTLTLYWQPERELYESYTAFAQALDAGGKVIAQYDRTPAEGMRPTTGWVPGEFIADRYRFEAWPAGGSMLVGLYETRREGLRRLTWTGPAGEPLGDALLLTVPSP